MSNMPRNNAHTALPDAIEVRRTDPVYMAHAYLTKVPVAAIVPFIEAFTRPGDLVLDPFAGSGMTGVAAAASGRRARLFDVSVLGRHIGRNYVNLVDAEVLRKAATEVVTASRARLDDVYGTVCRTCGRPAETVKVIWSMVATCGRCAHHVNFYQALSEAGWAKDRMICPACGESFTSRSEKVDEKPVAESIACQCQRTQIEQEHTGQIPTPHLEGLLWPDLPISPTRQMYVASALGRHGLTTTSAFFSRRNLAVLAVLKEAIDAVDDQPVRNKLLFAFTGILSRASKRYQWSRQRPLNAANANYYIAPVFYEWNVFDLFSRKVEAVIRSDEWIRGQRGGGSLFDTVDSIDVTYETASAASIPLADASVDYVFTDPPFGSNIFYADMNLFQEAWLGETTNEHLEAVVDRVDMGSGRTADRYEALLTGALSECRRIVRPGGCITMVFGNSSGKMWSLVQRAVDGAGLSVIPEALATLDKGQRSVKGLASGMENVATLDLILTMRTSDQQGPARRKPESEEIEAVVVGLLNSQSHITPSHLYLELVRHGFRHDWDLSGIDLRQVTSILESEGVKIDGKTGRLVLEMSSSSGPLHP